MPTAPSWSCGRLRARAAPSSEAATSSAGPRFSALERRRLELVTGGEERSVGEQTDQDSCDGDAPKEHVEDHYLQPDGLERIGPGDDHADHRPRQEDYPGRLRGVYERDEGALERGPQNGRDGLAARGSESEGRLHLEPLLREIVPDPGEGEARGVH